MLNTKYEKREKKQARGRESCPAHECCISDMILAPAS